MSDYTVNLPKTAFAMRADLPQKEPKLLEIWQQLDLAKIWATSTTNKGSFVLHDGPPYANGSIHLGHAFNKILKDIINKHKVLAGYQVHYVPGWDCHGLPIELNVEKQYGKAGKDLSVETFIQKCREYAAAQLAIQLAMFQRLGVIGSWDNYYQTMDARYEADIVRAMMTMVEAGYLLRGQKAVHWCPSCGSALAEAELEYQTVTSPAIDVKFTFAHDAQLVIPIWTTTPWTLPANEAVAINAEFTYVEVTSENSTERLIIAKDLVDQVINRYGRVNYRIIKSYLGSELIGQQLKHPFLEDKLVPLIGGEHVTLEMGTGAVHTAPAHGVEDYAVGLKYQLPVNNPVGPDGKFLALVPYFAGQYIFDANAAVIALLKSRNKLLHETSLQHSYPHCWRHKTKLIFRTTAQWFIGLDQPERSSPTTLRERALEAIKQVNWVPAAGQESITTMVQARPDWCISRQRFWGVPLTLLVHQDTDELHPEMSRLVQEVIAPKIEAEGLIYWHRLDPTEFLQTYAHQTATAAEYRKVSDSLDVWFNSGVSHQAVLERRGLKFPADLYVEGSDQYRGWFQSSLLTAVALRGKAPYQQVVTHGFCVDGDGHKMSKSLGNVIDPQTIVNRYGADVLRLWTASTYLHDDLAISEEILARTVDLYRTLRNTARFLLGNLFDFDQQQHLVASNEMLALDRYVVRCGLEMAEKVQLYFDQYQFHTAFKLIHTELVRTISGFYFSVIKDRLYTMGPNSRGRRSAQTALYYLLEMLVRILAPVSSFTAEEIWQEMRAMPGLAANRKASVLMSRWEETIRQEEFDLTQDEINQEDWINIMLFRKEINKWLEDGIQAKMFASSLEAEVHVSCGESLFASVNKLQDELPFVLLTAKAQVCVKSDGSPLEMQVITNKSPHRKCVRCWHRRAEITTEGELCKRCQDNLTQPGEIRRFA